MESSVKRNSKILIREKSALLIVDVQERILGVMNEHEKLMSNILKLVKGSKVLNVPIYYTEQYPKGLGSTAEVLLEELKNVEAIQKMSFSCSGAGDLFQSLIDSGISQVIVCGIESHVCVQQTVMDLLANGFQVDLAADACSSRSKTDYDFAMQRMSRHGAEVTTTESILFELLQVCGTDEFKAVSKLVK
jgi:nicotinamidase-related amidase